MTANQSALSLVGGLFGDLGNLGREVIGKIDPLPSPRQGELPKTVRIHDPHRSWFQDVDLESLNTYPWMRQADFSTACQDYLDSKKLDRLAAWVLDAVQKNGSKTRTYAGFLKLLEGLLPDLEAEGQQELARELTKLAFKPSTQVLRLLKEKSQLPYTLVTQGSVCYILLKTKCHGKKLGEGASSKVYTCIKVQLDRRKAEFWADQSFPTIKNGVIPAWVQAATAFDHPNVAKLDKCTSLYLNRQGVEKVQTFAALMDGDLRKQSPKMEVSTELLLDIASGLDYLHGHQLIHGDFNWKNVLTKGQMAKVADFDTLNATHDPCLFGTPVYSPPEHFAQKKCPIHPSADSWGFACMLFDLFKDPTGGLKHNVLFGYPREGETGLLSYLIQQDHKRFFLDPSTYLKERGWTNPSSLPVSLRDLAIRCLKENPLERPNMNEIIRVLSDLPAP